MKFVGKVVLAFLCMAGVAVAADMPAKGQRVAAAAPLDPWSGFYIGANIGYGAGHSSVSTVNTCLIPAACGPPFFSATTVDTSVNGINGGVQGGYNWWLSPGWLWGVEADFQFADQEGSAVSATAGPVSFTARQNLNWFGTVRGRIGPVVGNTLWYLTGGFAYGEREGFGSFSFGAPAFMAGSGSSSSTVGGWTVGLGAETKLNANWSVKLEYLHIQLESASTTFNTILIPPPGVALTSTLSGELENNVVRLGVNYRWQ
jgi:outer membrane immunogenic protein